MAADFTDNADAQRFELTVDGELVGWAEYRPAGESMIIAHTEVLGGHEGEGLGGAIVRGAVEGIAAQGKTVIAVCPFAAAYIASHPELQQHLDRSLRLKPRRDPGPPAH